MRAFCSSFLISSRDRHRPLLAFQRAQLGDLAFELGDRLLEVEIGADGGAIQNRPRVGFQGTGPDNRAGASGSVKAPLPGVLMRHYAVGGRSALLGQRMMLMHQLFQPLLEHVRVDLGRRDVGMAEQLLHGAQVGAAVEQMTGEGVAQAHAG